MYLKESRQELKKVNWPSRREVLRMTLMVIVFSAVVALILGGFDFLFDRVVLILFAGDTQGTETIPVPTEGGVEDIQTVPVPIEEAPAPSEAPEQ